jgi:hypothetical protein
MACLVLVGGLDGSDRSRHTTGCISFTPEGFRMAGRGAPTFLKRQKEQQRAARALAKRQAKQARRENRAGRGQDQDLELGVGDEPLENAGDAATDAAADADAGPATEDPASDR